MNASVIYFLSTNDPSIYHCSKLFDDEGNEHNLQHNVFQFYSLPSGGHIIIFGFYDYPGYERFCQKLNINPIDTKDFFNYN